MEVAMRKKSVVSPFPWQNYGDLLRKRIVNPTKCGYFTEDDAKKRALRLAVGSAGDLLDGNFVRLYWLLDPDDGTIVEARYQLFGQSALIGAAEFTSDIIEGKNYDQAKRISAELIDKEARDRGDEFAFPKETYPHLNLLIDAIDQTAEQCEDIPLPAYYVAPPTPSSFGETLEGGYPGFDQLTLKQQVALIEEVLNQDIRPYISLDAGGVEVVNLLEGKKVVISYQGACTTCYSSTGATLSYIQQVLRAKIHPDIEVVPDFTL